jgi:BolA protein
MIDIIKNKLSVFNPELIEVINQSHLHMGHTNHKENSHFKIKIISSEFNNLSKIEIHRKINNILSKELESEIHALSIDAKGVTYLR